MYLHDFLLVGVLLVTVGLALIIVRCVITGISVVVHLFWHHTNLKLF